MGVGAGPPFIKISIGCYYLLLVLVTYLLRTVDSVDIRSLLSFHNIDSDIIPIERNENYLKDRRTNSV